MHEDGMAELIKLLGCFNRALHVQAIIHEPAHACVSTQ